MSNFLFLQQIGLKKGHDNVKDLKFSHNYPMFIYVLT